MIVGAWNVQRAANLASTNWDTRARAGLAWAEVISWIEAGADQAPAIAFLSEVPGPDGGVALQQALNTESRFGRTHTSQFYGVRGARGGTSPCSFLLIADDMLHVDFDTDVRQVGASTRRPYLEVRVRSIGWTFVGVHIKANRTASWDEILTMLTDLRSAGNVCMIGDMNYDFDDIGEQQRRELTQLGFTAYAPGIPRTWVRSTSDPALSTTRIDFAIVSSDRTPVTAATLLNTNYSDWPTIDHAPVFYDVPTRVPVVYK